MAERVQGAGEKKDRFHQLTLQHAWTFVLDGHYFEVL